MRNNFGFTLIELLVIIAILAVLSSIGTPAFLKWRSDSKLRDAVSSLRGDLEMAKLRAMRENEFVVVLLMMAQVLGEWPKTGIGMEMKIF